MTELDRSLFLDGEALHRDLCDPYIGKRIIVVPEVTSTNDYIWQLAQEGMANGLVVFAEQQTAGRGQRGNRWESVPHKGLSFSILLRPGILPAQSTRLTSWAAQSIATTIEEELGIIATIKLPNDVLVDGRKVAGVLVEMRVETGGAYAAIIGVGVNVNQCLADFSAEVRLRAGSLALAAGRDLDRQKFAVALLRHLDRSYQQSFAL